MSKPLQVGVREFREDIQKYDEPVEVFHTRGTLRLLGTWIPQSYAEAQEKKSAKQAQPRKDG